MLRWITRLFIFSFLSFSSMSVFSWDHEISLGYGDAKEVDQNYYNSGVVLNGKIYRFPKIDDTLYASIDGTIASINASTTENTHLTTFVLAGAMRAYFTEPMSKRIRPYIQASFGPAYLSSKTLGNRTQGANYAFQSTLEVGTEVGIDHNHHAVDFNIRMMHYCNAGLFHPNQGINLTPVFSVGYQF